MYLLYSRFANSIWLLGVSTLLILVCPGGRSLAVTPVHPRVFGFDIPAAAPIPGGDRRVKTISESGDEVVAKVHVEVGNYFVVLMPDGTLVSRKKNETEATDEAFIPATKDEIAARLLKGKLRGFKTKQTLRYLYIYNTSDTFAVATSRIMETMFKGVGMYSKTQKINAHAPPVPMVVIMFRTPEQYQAYSKMPEEALAYYNIITNHVVMYEESELYKIKPELAIQQSLATIAHEGAHQILHNIGVQQRLSVWPMWLSEGYAEFMSPTAPGRQFRWKGAGMVNDMRMNELESLLKVRSNVGVTGDVVKTTVIAGRLTSTGYASAWALTHYLAKKHRLDFHKYVKSVSELGPLQRHGEMVGNGIVPANQELFVKSFGGDFQKTEKLMILHLRKLPYRDPFAEFPHYVGTITATVNGQQRRDARAFMSLSLVKKWLITTMEELPEDAQRTGRAKLSLHRNRPLAERYAYQFRAGR